MTPTTWAMLMLLSMCWAASFFFIGIAVAELPIFTIVLLGVGILGETLKVGHVADMALVFLGLALRNASLPALLRRRA